MVAARYAGFRDAVASLETDAFMAQVEVAGALLDGTLRAGRTVLWCGNGGSAADAQHFAAELVGRLTVDRRGLSALALTVDTSALTAIANDYSYAEVFSRQVEALGREGDTLVALSTSGRSPNVVRAAQVARDSGINVVSLLGPAPAPLDELSDVALHCPVPAAGASVERVDAALVQICHGIVGHLLCHLAERSFLP